MDKKVTNNKEFMLRCGKRVKECREAAGYTQSELAEAIEVLPENNGKSRNDKHISAVERGERHLSIEYARLMSKILNVREEYLLCQDDFKTKEYERDYLLYELSDLNKFLLSLFKVNGISIIESIVETEEGTKFKSTENLKIIVPEKMLIGQKVNISGKIQTPKSIKVCVEIDGIQKDIPIDTLYYLQKDIVEYVKFKCRQFEKDFQTF